MMAQLAKWDVVFVIGLLASCLPALVRGNDDAMVTHAKNAQRVVEHFYQAIKEQRCEDAMRLRPGYPEKRCRAITDVSDLRTASSRARLDPNGSQVIELQVTIHKDKNLENWHGFLTVMPQEGQWKIVNDSYLSVEKVGSLDAYMAAPDYPTIHRQAAVASASPITALQPVARSLDKSSVESVGDDDPAHDDRVPPVSPATSVPTRLESAGTKDATQHLPIRDAPVASDRERVPPDDATRPSGTTTILDACWTPEALHELPGERTVRNHLPADHRPPARISPRQPNAPLRDEFARSVRSVRPVNGEKLVALTFDLCEQANEITGYDGAIVDLLRAAGVHATFYAGGKWMRSHPTRTMQLMADPLFEIGNHAWTHGNLRVLRGQEMEAQIQWTQAQYELLRDQLLDSACAAAVPEHARQRIPPLPTTFRFPYGTCDATALTAVAQAPSSSPMRMGAVGIPRRR